MAIDPKRLLLDLQSADEDMVVLAMRTLKHVQPTTLANNPEWARSVLVELDKAAHRGSDEVQFFAQECVDYVRKHAGALAASPAAPLPPPSTASARVPVRATPPPAAQNGAGSVSREQALAVLARGAGAEAGPLVAALAALRGALRPEDVPALRGLLGHAEASVRRDAILTLQSLRDERVILENLLPFLHDRDGEVRAAALGAVRGIDHGRLMTLIETMLRANKINVKVAGVYILAHLQGEEVVRLLAVAARDSNEEVRARVVDALQGRRGKEVLVILKGLVNDLDIDVAEKALKLYEKQKFEEGILNSSAELGDLIMEKLREISQDGDDGPAAGAEPRDEPTVPVDGAHRVAVGQKEPQVTEYVVPKTQRKVRAGEAPAGAAPGAGGADEAAAGKRLSECPDVIQKACEEVYDQIDDLLEEMGRRIWSLEKSNTIVDKRFSKLNYEIQRYEDMLAKRNSAPVKESFWARLSAGNKRLQDKQQINLEVSLAERYRQLGELAVELGHGESLLFKEIEDYYGRVEGLLKKARELKAKGA